MRFFSKWQEYFATEFTEGKEGKQKINKNIFLSYLAVLCALCEPTFTNLHLWLKAFPVCPG